MTVKPGVVTMRQSLFAGDADTSKRRVIIFSCSGGGGHATATTAIKAYLGDVYDVVDVNIFSEVLGTCDPFRLISDGSFSGEDIYNFLIRQGAAWGGNMLCSMGCLLTQMQQRRLTTLIEEFLIRNKPDVLISVIPIVNGLIYTAAERLNIPFAIITTDLYTATFWYGIHQPSYKHFYFCVPCADELVVKEVAPAGIPESCIRYVGYPVRPAFLERSYVEELRSQLQLPQDKPIVMVMMGAAGSTATIGYARKLSHIDIPMHIIFCVGRNVALLQAIRDISFPDHITISLFSFTEQVGDLMRASDILITKSGSASVCEALYVGIPLLLDNTAPVLLWEQLNFDFIQQHGCGSVITSLHHLPIHMHRLLEDAEHLREIRTGMQCCQLPDPRHYIPLLVKEMISHADQGGLYSHAPS